MKKATNDELKSAKTHVKGFMDCLPKDTKVSHYFSEEDYGHIITTYEFKYKRDGGDARKVTMTIEEKF